MGELSQHENEQLMNPSQSLPINRWPVEKILEWFNKKFPTIYEEYKNKFIENQITGEVLLELNKDCIDYLNIQDSNLR